MFKRIVILLLFVQVSFGQTSSKELIDKDEITPRYENPREDAAATFGSWQTEKNYGLEFRFGGRDNVDPFEKLEFEGHSPVKRVDTRTVGKSLSPAGSKNVELKINIESFKNNYVLYSDGDKYDYFYIPHKSFQIILSGWADAPEEIIMDSKNKTYATFDYIIDEKFSGQFVTDIGWRNLNYDPKTFKPVDEPIKVPGDLILNDYMYKFQQKENYEFIERLKIGKKLYLRFGKLFQWNGYLNDEGGEFDTSIISDEYKIPRYTYEFDLTGSSKALNF
jgi:hypothetical protein